MPFEFGIPIDPGFKKILQSRVRTLLQAKTEGFPGSYPVQFEPSHLQLLTNEEYFVTEKVAGVRYMLLSTHTPKGPACFLIDRHYDITFVPQLLLPMRDNPAKYQNETLLDGEMVLDHDGAKKTLRFLVFDLTVLNGTVVTQRSYSTRLGMMDQDILGVQASKPSDVISKEPFTIERKTMQRSYGLNIILSGSKKHKHGGEGLIFVPVKQPYVPGTSPKLLKWKSHTTAQFLIKVTQSRERKPLYCIHVRQGSGSKFYDYVTPEPALASEWHTSSPDGKIAEFWWDAQWPTQMFEKGYGLETRTGGWRFFRVREDKKDVDDETTVQALVKSLEAPVTKAQLESSIDQIRSQWKAREAGVSSNGSSTSSLLSSSHSAPRPPVRPLIINSTTTSSSHVDAQPPLLTPALSSHYLQSPSMASHSSSSYFSRKDRERKSSMDEHGSSSPHTSTLSHPLPPKPSFQPRKSSMDQAQTHSSTSGNSDDTAASTEADQNSTPLPSSAGVPPLQKNEIKASTPPPMSPATPGSSTSTAPAVACASSVTSASPTSTAASSSLPSLSVVKNPLKLPQVQAHLQPIKPWMTTAPVPRAPSVEKAGKTNKLERRGSKDVIGGSGDPLVRPGLPSSRKSSLNIVDTVKEATSTIPRPSSSPKSMEQAEASKPANSSGSSSTSGTVATSTALEAKPQTPTPAHTPTPAGMLPMNGAALPPSSMSNPLPAIALPNTLHRSMETELAPESTSTDMENRGKNVSTSSSADDPLAPTTRPQVAGEDYSDLSSPVLGKRALALSSAGGDPSDDTIAQRRKLSEVLHSPKVEPAMAENDALPVTTLQSSKPQVGSPLAIGDRERPASKPLPLSPLSSPDFRAVNGAERQMETHPRAAGASNPSQANERPNEAASYDDMMTEPKQEEPNPKQPVSGSGYARQDVEMEDATRPVVKREPAWNGQEKENNPLIPSSSPATAVTEQVRNEVAAGVAGGTLSAVALSTTEQMAYGPPSNQERMLTMAKARAVAASKLNHQRQEQAIKERKLREDTEKFRERSRIRKEKAQEHKTQEVNETPQVQDRRAQPVRQINQQQGRLFNQETSGIRGQNQGVQRTASPQDQQRIPYSTRQSRAGSRLDAQLSAQNSPKGQARAMQTSANQKGQESPMGEPTTRLQASGGDAFPNRSDPTSPSESRSEQPTAVPSDQRMLHPGDVPRHHRRISSMDHSFAHVQSPKQTGSVPAAANQRDMTDMEYGQPFIKRLDVGQLGESSHRRSHSDVGVAYKPVVTAIVEPQPIARDHLTTDKAGDPSQQNPIMTRIADDGRQGIHPSQSPYSQTLQRYSMNGSEMLVNSRPSSRAGEATRATRESKARLQFILNDDPPSPEGHQADDLPERRPSSDGPAWNPHNPESEAVPRGSAASVPSAGYVRQQYPSEYGLVDYQEAQMPPKTTAGPGVTGTSLRRQPTKKQKLSQDVVVHDIPYGGRVDQYEYHMRQSQIQNLPSRTSAQAPPRPASQADRWPPHPPHPSGQQGIQGQAQPNASHLQSSSRRMPGHEIPVSTAPQQQQAPHLLNRQMYPGQEAAQLGRAVHPDHPYLPTSHMSMQESPRPPERPSHSRHSSMSKSGMVQEPIQPPPSQSYPGSRKTQQPHGQVTPPEQYTRGYPPPQAAQGPGLSRAATQQQQQQQPSYQYQQQQQQQHAAATPPSRRKAEQQASSYAPSSTSGGPAGYEQQRPGQPQHPHSQQQQQHHQHSLANRHHEQEHMRDSDAAPGMHPKHGHPQFRSGHHEGGAGPAGQGYYEQEAHPSNFGPGRGPMYGSQSLQPSPAYDRQYPPYHPSEATHDPAYRFTGNGKRPSAGGEHPLKEEHGRPGHVGRPSIGQMPGDHPSQQQGHGQFHPAQRPHQQHPSHLQQQDYRAGPSPYHYQQPPPQHSSQQKLVHMQEHAQYSGGHHPGPPNVSSPRPGQPAGVHPSELDPNYRQQAPHGHGGGGPPW